MSDPNNKDRRKSAHWTDADTAVLIDVLLRYKDSGRTQDNGFKPEVWKEAAELVKSSTIIGGPKTPEACKSRWQRLQRDFKAVKELEMIPGFTWDRTQHKLCASQDTWDAAEKSVDAHKCQKIHLPSYDALVILCPVDANKLRNKPRSSLGATSDTSSMLSMSVGNPQTPSMNPMTGTPTGMVNGQLSAMDMGMGDGMLQWDAGNMEGDGDFEGSFTMPDGQIFTMTRGQKRMATFDSSMLGSSTQTIGLDGRTSPPKRARTSSADILHQRNAMLQQHQQGQSRHQQPQQQQPPQTQNQRQQQDMGQGHSHPQPAQHHGHTHQPSNLTVYPMHLPPQPTNSPEYPTTNSHLNPHSLMSSPTQLTSASLQAVTGHPHSQPQQTSQSQQMHQQLHQYQQSQHLAPQPPPHTLPQIASNPFVGKADASIRYAPPNHPPPLPPAPRPTPSPAPSRRISPVQSESTTDKAQIHQAGLSEAQRRTQAILQLQSREMDMPDEDLVEVLAEFEANVAVADTYLAIQRDGLRRMYLGKVIKRRKGG